MGKFFEEQKAVKLTESCGLYSTSSPFWSQLHDIHDLVSVWSLTCCMTLENSNSFSAYGVSIFSCSFHFV
jgi:hypothetical protein